MKTEIKVLALYRPIHRYPGEGGPTPEEMKPDSHKEIRVFGSGPMGDAAVTVGIGLEDIVNPKHDEIRTVVELAAEVTKYVTEPMPDGELPDGVRVNMKRSPNPIRWLR